MVTRSFQKENDLVRKGEIRNQPTKKSTDNRNLLGIENMIFDFSLTLLILNVHSKFWDTKLYSKNWSKILDQGVPDRNL